jgi:hypothetical protein
MAARQAAAHPEGITELAYDARLATRITSGVDRRLRMLALARSQPVNHVLDSLLDEALPPADELASQLAGPETEAAA